MKQIISRRKFRFQNPNVDLLAAGVGQNSPKYEQAVFETNGKGELQQAPDWINKPMGPRVKAESTHPDVDKNQTNLNTWKWGVQDGHLMEVEVKNDQASDLEKAAAARQAEQAKRIADGTEGGGVPVKTHEELSAMTKDDLIEHAKVNHDLELTGNMKKDDIIASIKEAQQTDAA